jgi:putative endonuclease
MDDEANTGGLAVDDKQTAAADPETDTIRPWFVYILRCADDSLYTGIALDVNKRLAEHNGIVRNGARYTQARRPVRLVYQEATCSRSDACKREYAIKSLSRTDKESLIRAASPAFG